MKRKLITETSVSNNTRSKKPRIIIPEHMEYVSATDLHNYMIDDTLVDWLKLQQFNSYSEYSCREVKNNNFTNFIMRKGHEFEENIVKYINDNIHPIITISPYITQKSIEKSISLMKEGYPIIHSIPVLNSINKTKGVLDLLVRSDYINKLFNQKIIDEDLETKKAPGLNGNYHYIVIDVKFSTLPLRSDGIHLQNIDHYPAYKAQLLIYTQAIAQIQKYNPNYAFILGRRWKYTKNNVVYTNNSCLDRLGKIDYNDIDIAYIENTEKGIEWVQRVRRNAYKWKVNPPSCIELYPNMCKDSGTWNKEKQDISDSIGEITSIWCVSQKHRNKAIEKGIYSWRDKNCTAENIEFNGKKASTVDKILQINRQDKYKILPEKIENNLFEWKNSTNNLYIDFETLSDCSTNFNELPLQENKQIIFMIGIGWIENDIWNYKNFTCKRNSYEEEFRIMNEFANFISLRNNPKLFFWCAEDKFWKKSYRRHFEISNSLNKLQISNKWNLNNWCDLCLIFRQEPIVIKDCFNFGLKNIAKALYKHNMISIKLESDCKDGMTAMVEALKLYNSNSAVENSYIMNDIIKYNEFDCKILKEILFFMQKNLS
tara:strand:- start:20308 stop:22104 length:1797 start_codon:yes stop_codon:yes gene_type:complete